MPHGSREEDSIYTGDEQATRTKATSPQEANKLVDVPLPPQQPPADLGAVTVPPIQVSGGTGTKLEGDFSVNAGDAFVPNDPEADLAKASQGKVSEADLATAKKPQDVLAAEYDPEVVDPDAVQVQAAQTEVEKGALLSNQVTDLTKGLSTGQIPGWAQPAVAQVDADLAARGLGRSSIGEQAYFDAIMNVAIGIGSQQAQVVQQISMANLSNRQQSVMQDAQIKANFLLSNQSSSNAAAQFNAQSQNQVNTFMASLKTSVETFNAQQANAMSTFNANAENSMSQFNAQVKTQTSQFNSAQVNSMAKFNQQISLNLSKFNTQNQLETDMFNKNNALAIEQSNVAWRRKVTTQQNQVDNQTNLQNAQNRYKLSSQQLSQNWQISRDFASWYWQSGENYEARKQQIAISTQNNKTRISIGDAQQDAAINANIAQGVADVTSAFIQYKFPNLGTGESSNE